MSLSEFKGRVQLYQGLGHALHEIMHGLALFLPHKRSISVFPVGSPYPTALLPAFYRESYQVNLSKWKDFQGSETWFESQNKDLLAVLSVHDHAFTGEKYPSHLLNETLAEKRIPYIQVFHTHPNLPLDPPDPFGVHIYLIDQNRCIALIGARLRFHSLVSPLLNWEQSSNLTWTVMKEDEVRVKAFEDQLPKGLSPYFSSLLNKQMRTFDRSVLTLDAIGGDLFIHEWARISGVKLMAPGRSNPIETPHLCRWGGAVVGPWWSEDPIDETLLSRTIILSLIALNRSTNLEILNEALSTCLKRQKLI